MTTVAPKPPSRQGFYSFVESMEERTGEAKELLLPRLQLEDHQRPWSSTNLARLFREREGEDAVVQSALEHVWTYEVPLLRFEERLESRGLSMEQFAERMHRYERRFWRKRFVEVDHDALGAGPDSTEYVCEHHRVGAHDIRRLAREEGCWDVDTIARATGATTTCGTCRLAVARLLIEELSIAKAEGRVA